MKKSDENPHTIRSAATRPDGWPQATTLGYANEGLTLYFLCGPDSQKAACEHCGRPITAQRSTMRLLLGALPCRRPP
jgi:hypothetical protein